MSKRFNGPKTYPTIVKYLTEKGPQLAERVAGHLVGEGLDSRTIKYSNKQGDVTDHVRLILDGAVKAGIVKRDGLYYHV